jgi:hypothetical protein
MQLSLMTVVSCATVVCAVNGFAQAAGGYGSSSSNSSDEDLARRTAAKRDTVRHYTTSASIHLVYVLVTGSTALLASL